MWTPATPPVLTWCPASGHYYYYFISDSTIIKVTNTVSKLILYLRFPNNPWSYEACATPAPGSPLCPVAPASPAVLPIAPTVVNPAPVHPVPVAPTDIHVTVPHHDAIPHHQAGVGPVPAGVPSLNDVLSGGYDPESIGDIRQGDASSKSEYSG